MKIDSELSRAIHAQKLPPSIESHDLFTSDEDTYTFFQTLLYLSSGTANGTAYNSRVRLLSSALLRYCTADTKEGEVYFKPLNSAHSTPTVEHEFSPYMSIGVDGSLPGVEFWPDEDSIPGQTLPEIVLPERFAQRIQDGVSVRHLLTSTIQAAQKAVDFATGFCNPLAPDPEVQRRYQAAGAEFYRSLGTIWASESVLGELGQSLVQQFPKGMASLPAFSGHTVDQKIGLVRQNPLLYTPDSPIRSAF